MTITDYTQEYPGEALKIADMDEKVVSISYMNILHPNTYALGSRQKGSIGMPVLGLNSD